MFFRAQKSEFDRAPSDEEVAFAKREGKHALFEQVKTRYRKGKSGAEVALTVSVAERKSKRKQEGVEGSSESDEESARTSFEDEDEEVSYKDTASSSSNALGDDNSEEEESSDREVETGNRGLGNEEESNEDDSDTSSSEAATSDHGE